MMQADLIVTNITQLITCASKQQAKRGHQMRDIGLIENGAIAVKDGQIIYVGTSDEIRGQVEGAIIIHADGKIVCPGLVDCHTHTVFAGDRLNDFESRIQGKSYMEIMAEGGGIASTMYATRSATTDELVELATKRLNAMLRLGTTTVEIKTGYGLDTASEIKMLQVIAALDQQHPITIVPTFLGAHAMPPEHPDTNQYIELILDKILPAIDAAFGETHFVEEGMPLSIDIFCEQGVFDVEQSKRILQAGQERNMIPKAHVDEFVNLGGVPMAIDLDAISVDHLDVTPTHELELLAESNTVGVMLPAVNFNLGSTHFGNARKLIDSGGVLALSTDFNPGSAPTMSLPMVMAIACRYQKLLPSEALNACTINAAQALGMTDKIGSLEVGKQADLTILDTTDYRTLAYEFGSNLVETVVIKGQQVWNASS